MSLGADGPIFLPSGASQGHCHVNRKVKRRSMFGSGYYRAPLGRSLSGGNIGRGDFLPDREPVGHLSTPFGRRESVSAGPEMR
jgi:hypothetical protein